MATIKDTFELNDKVTGPLRLIIKSMEDTIGAMSMMENKSVDLMGGAEASIIQAKEMLDSFQADLQTPMKAPPIPPVSAPPPPPPEPYQWNSGPDLEIFANSDMRMGQELASANTMANQLIQNQAKIQTMAAGTDILPDSALRDLTQLQARMQDIQNEISSLEANPIDKVTSPAAAAQIERLRGNLSEALQEQNNLNEAVKKLDPAKANEAYLRLRNTIDSTDIHIRDNIKAQNDFNKSAQAAQGPLDGIINKVKIIAAAMFMKKLISTGVKYSDQMALTNARLGLMEGGLENVSALQDKIYQSANRSRGAYQATADVITKLGITAKDAFSGTDEIIAFTELLNKQFKIGGAGAQEQAAGMYQLTQAMASGRLQGDEFRSIIENAPMLAKAIASYMGVTMGELRKMSSEGLITAEVIKGALFSTAEETNAQFEKLPKTWENIATAGKNAILFAFQPALDKINQLANSPFISNMVNIGLAGINILAGAVTGLFNIIETAGTWMANNWSWIKYIMMFIATVALIMIGSALIALLPIIWGMVTSVVAMAVAWGMLNWPILLVAAAIVGLLALLNYFGVSTEQVISFVGGVFGVLFAFIYNKVAFIWNIIASFAEFLINVFIDPVYAIENLLYQLDMAFLDFAINSATGIEEFAAGGIKAFREFVNFGIRGINGLIDALNGFISAKLPDWLGGGTIGGKINHVSEIDSNYTTGISDGLKGLKNALVAPTSKDNVYTAPRMEQMDYGNAFDTGAKWGSDIATGIDNLLKGVTGLPDNSAGEPNWDALAAGAGTGNPTGGKLDSIGKIDDAVEISDEDIKLMKDIAQVEFMNKFTTLRPEANITFGDVRETADTSKIMTYIEDMIEEAMASSLVLD